MPLSYTDLTEQLLLETGQFIGGLDATLLIESNLVAMYKRELAFYSKYHPLQGTTSGRLYNNKVFQLENDSVIPDQIIEIYRREVSSYLFGGSRRNGLVSNYFWRYDKPVLRFNLADDIYEYSYIINHKWDDANRVIPTLSLADHKFINLCVGRFMMTVGRSRRAFTIDELPISTDAAELVSEGKEIYDAAVDEVKQSSDYWLALIA